MSLAPDHAERIHYPTPANGRERHADVIEIGHRLQPLTGSAPAAGLDRDRSPDTVILGRSVPRRSEPDPARPLTDRPIVDRPIVGGPILDSPIVDTGGLHRMLVNRRERYYSAPPPPRIRHGAWMLSSIVIAAGGVAAVVAAGAFGDVPLVATIALIATVLCGALLVAAQITEEVRRTRFTGRGIARG